MAYVRGATAPSLGFAAIATGPASLSWGSPGGRAQAVAGAWRLPGGGCWYPVVASATVVGVHDRRLRRRTGPFPSAAPHPRRPDPVTIGVVVALSVALLAAGCGAPAGHRHSLVGDPTPIGGATPLPVGATGDLPATATTTAPTGIAPTTAAPTTAPPTTAPPATVAPRPLRPYAVGSTLLDFTDASRTTAGRAGRRLPSLVYYPVAGAAAPTETPNAAALPGGWPLVVFAAGYNTAPLTYRHLLHHLAEAGFVVFAPAFPLESAGGPLDETDLVNEPADLRFIVTEAIQTGRKPGALAGSIDPAHIALVGQSDGGEAVLGAAFLAGQSDNRVGPVVSMAAEGILNGDHLTAAAVPHPLLVEQGSADTIVPAAKTDHLYSTAPSPKADLHLMGAGHLPPITDANQWRPVVETVVVDWLDEYLGGPNAAGAASRLTHDGNVAGVAATTLG